MAVLSAVSNDAHYLRDGKAKEIPGDELLNSMRDVTLTKDMELKGYANRNSLNYKADYRIPEVKTLLRGTLRYPGFGPVIAAAKSHGFLSHEPFAAGRPDTWRELSSKLSGVPADLLESEFSSDSDINSNFDWLGCFSDDPVTGDNPIQAFCNLLCEKLKYEADEQDMIVMQHRMILVDEQGNKTFHRSTMVEKGDKQGFSAMAKTVGYPAAIAADMILSGRITRKGVCIPVTKDIYEPVLTELEKLNISMTEEIITAQSELSFLNHL